MWYVLLILLAYSIAVTVVLFVVASSKRGEFKTSEAMYKQYQKDRLECDAYWADVYSNHTS